MDLIIVGQPTIIGIEANGEYLVESQPCRDDSKAFRLTQRDYALTQKAMQINLIHALNGKGRKPEESIIIQPLSARKRRAKKRGWARLRVATVESSFDQGLSGYLLFASPSS